MIPYFSLILSIFYMFILININGISIGDPMPPIQFNRVIENYPFKIHTIQRPDLKEASMAIGENIENNIKKMPDLLYGGKAGLSNMKNDIIHEQSVKANYLLLGKILGMKDPDNNGSTEYRRLTQPSHVSFSLKKNNVDNPDNNEYESESLTKAIPDLFLLEKPNEKINNIENHIKVILRQQNDINKITEFIKKKNVLNLQDLLKSNKSSITSLSKEHNIPSKYYQDHEAILSNPIAWLSDSGRTNKGFVMSPAMSQKYHQLYKEYSPINKKTLSQLENSQTIKGEIFSKFMDEFKVKKIELAQNP